MSIFISPLIAKLLFVCTITVIVMTTAFSSPSSSLFVMAAIGDIAFDSIDKTTISGAGYSNMKNCVGLSTNDGNDAICTCTEKALVKTTLEPFAFGATTTTTAVQTPLVLESQDLVLYVEASGVGPGGPHPLTANYFSISTLDAKSTPSKLLGTPGGYPSAGDWFISSNFLLMSDQVKTLYRCDLNNLADDCKTLVHTSDAFSHMTADDTATYAFILQSRTKILQFNINSGATTPSFEAEVNLPNTVDLGAFLFYKKFSDGGAEKIYLFDSDTKLIVTTITSGTMATPVEHTTDTYDSPSGWYNVAFVGDAHLLVSTGNPNTVYSVDLSDNRRVQSTNVACTGAYGAATSLVYVSSTRKIHTIVSGNPFSGGTEKCLYSFTGPPTPAPTPIPTPAPTLAPTPAPGGNQQNNQDGASLSDSEQEAVIGVTAAVGAIGVIAIIAMIVYVVFFKNKADENEKTEGEGNTNAPDGSKNDDNAV